MKHVFLRAGAVFAVAAGLLWGQAPAPAFEVATIRPAPPISALAAQIQSGKMHVGMAIDKARVDIGFLSVNDLIPIAFRLKPFQVVGPDSMKADRWDILATIPEGVSTDLVPEMLQALLKDRFKLQFHRDTKEHSVYALVVGKDGPKLKESDPDADKPPAEAPPGGQQISTPQGTVSVNPSNKSLSVNGGPNGPMKIMMPDGQGSPMHLEMLKISMSALADLLSPMMDKPVVDMTGLKGTYHLSLELPMEDLLNMARAQAANLGVPIPAAGGPAGVGNAAALASDPSGSSLTKAVQQLGLRMDARKAPMETIVVDHVEKTPTEN